MKSSVLSLACLSTGSATKLSNSSPIYIPEGSIFMAQDSPARSFFNDESSLLQTKFIENVQNINSPEELAISVGEEDLVQMQDIKPGQDIIDKNLDGIEDDQLGDLAFDQAKFDKYWFPNVMGPAEHVYNTLDGSMPGFR